jgi:hypothetical protein
VRRLRRVRASRRRIVRAEFDAARDAVGKGAHAVRARGLEAGDRCVRVPDAVGHHGAGVGARAVRVMRVGGVHVVVAVAHAGAQRGGEGFRAAPCDAVGVEGQTRDAVLGGVSLWGADGHGEGVRGARATVERC